MNLQKCLLSFIVLFNSIFCEENLSSKKLKGFYVSVFGSYILREVTPTYKISFLKIDLDQQKNFHGFCYGLLTGYGKQFNNFYGGIEVLGKYDTINSSKTIKIINEGKDCLDIKYERSPAFGIGLRLGVLPTNCFLVFIRPTIEISQDKMKWKDSDGYVVSKKRFNLSFVPSVGIEKLFNNNILLRCEYGYSLGNTLSKQFQMVVSQTKYTQHSIKVGIGCQF